MREALPAMGEEGSTGTARRPGGGGRTVGVLGSLVVLDDDEIVGDALGGPKQRLVLALLLCGAGRAVPVGRLTEGVWGADADGGTRRSLRAYVSRLRGALDGVATIDHRHGGYALELDAVSDAARFEQLVQRASGQLDGDPDAARAALEAALQLWRGPPFGDLTHEPALSTEVARLERLRLRALEMLAQVEIDRGGQQLVPELRRLVRDHPLREPLRRLLLLALYRSGRQAEALQEYERLRSVLAEQLGADPSRELQELHAAILRQDPSLDAPAAASAVAVTAAAGVTASTMVGRDRERERAVGLLDAARAGRSQVLLTAGEAGVGKSRLLSEVAAAARHDGVDVLVGRCMELGDAVMPLAPVGQALRRLAEDATHEELEEWLGPDRDELARIVPELGVAPPVEEGAEVQGRLFVAVRDVLARGAARTPLLLVIEDVHWADRATLDLLVYLARSVVEQRVLVAATFRTDELHRRHPLRGVVGELVRLPQVTRIDLRSLGRDDVAAMVAQLLGGSPDDAVVDDVLARSSGNPFYVEELVAARRDGSPRGLSSGLRDVITSRLERLPETSRELVEVAAVAGGSVDQRLLAEVAGDDPLVLAGRLRPAVERHVLVVGDTGFRFRHDLVREVVVDDLLPGERSALHRRIAAVLEDHPDLASGGRDRVDAELAHHWRAAREDARALDALLRAAARARRAGAYADAMALEEQALQSWATVGPDSEHDHVEILRRAAETARFAGRPRRAIALLRQALQEVGRAPAREADLRSMLALTLVNGGIDLNAGLLEADRAVDLVTRHADARNRASVVHTAARLRLIAWDVGEETIRLGRQALAIARETGDEGTELHARITVATALVAAGAETPASGVAQLRAALRAARDAGDVRASARALNNLVIGLDVRDDPDRTDVGRILDDAMQWLDEEIHRDYVAVQRIRISVARTALHSGDTRRARRALAALDLDRLAPGDEAEFLETRSELRLVQGRLDEALADAQRILDVGLDHTRHTGWAHGLAALVAAERGRVDEVRRIVDQQEDLRSTAVDDAAALVATLRLLRALVRAEVDAAGGADGDDARTDHLERADRALTEIHRLHDAGVGDGGPLLLPDHRRFIAWNVAVADAEHSRGRTPDPDLWRAAMASARAAHGRTYARFRLAQALDATGDGSGVQELQRAHGEASQMGAARLVEQLRQSGIDEVRPGFST